MLEGARNEDGEIVVVCLCHSRLFGGMYVFCDDDGPHVGQAAEKFKYLNSRRKCETADDSAVMQLGQQPHPRDGVDFLERQDGILYTCAFRFFLS